MWPEINTYSKNLFEKFKRIGIVSCFNLVDSTRSSRPVVFWASLKLVMFFKSGQSQNAPFLRQTGINTVWQWSKSGPIACRDATIVSFGPKDLRFDTVFLMQLYTGKKNVCGYFSIFKSYSGMLSRCSRRRNKKIWRSVLEILWTG